jgi:hypothetical protein
VGTAAEVLRLVLLLLSIDGGGLCVEPERCGSVLLIGATLPFYTAASSSSSSSYPSSCYELVSSHSLLLCHSASLVLSLVCQTWIYVKN